MSSLLVAKAVNYLVGAETHKLRLPLPPSANIIWRQNHTRRTTYLHPVYEAWLEECTLLNPKIKHHGHKVWDVDIKFFIYYVNKIANMDMDNRIKPAIDFIKTLIGIDDRYLKRGSWERIDLKVPKTRSDHFCEVIITLY